MSEQNSADGTRHRVRTAYLADEAETVKGLISDCALIADDRQAITDKAIDLVERVRRSGTPTMMEGFLAEYGLSSP